MDKNKAVSDAIEAAKTINNNDGIAELNAKILPGDMVELKIDPPRMFNDEGKPLPKKEVNKSINEYCDTQKLGILTKSIGMAMGTETPTGFALRREVVESFLKSLGSKVIRLSGSNGLYRCLVKVPGGDYTVYDTKRWQCALRALHFAITRHDPDTDEFVKRKLYQTAVAADKAQAK